MKPIRALFWKEYRQQILLVAAIFLLGILLQLSAFMSSWFSNTTPQFWTIGMFATALYAAGASSILFAREHDEKTFGFLRGLPVTGAAVFLGKIAWLLISVAVLAIFMGIESGFWAAISGTSDSGASVFGVMSVAVVEALCWGLFWSVRVQRQLTALLATFFSASFAAYFMAVLWNRNFGGGNQDIIVAYAGGAPFRLILCAVIGTCAVVQGRKWLYRPMTPPIPKTLTPAQTAAATKRLLAPPKYGAMRNLLWLSYRQSRSAFAALGAMFVLLIVSLINIYYLHWVNSIDAQFELFLLLMLGTAVGLIFCCSTFYRDQQYNAASMLANIGVAPSKIWWSRILVFGGAYLIYTIPLLILFGTFAAMVSKSNTVYFQWGGTDSSIYLTMIVTLLFAIFCFGQMISLFVRSIILGIIAAAGLSLAVGLLWTMIVNYMFGPFGIVWAVLPILIACLIASRIRTADWMRGRNSWAGWYKPVSALIVPTLLILFAIPFVRVFSVPIIQFGYYPDPSFLNFGNIDENQKSMNKHYSLAEREPTVEHVKDYILAEQKAIIYPQFSSRYFYFSPRFVSRFANSQYATTETIKEMIRFLEDYAKKRPPFQERLTRQYEIEYRDAFYGTMPNEKGKTVRKPLWYRYGLFWEKYRIMRRLNYEFQIESQWIEEIDRLVNDNEGNFRQIKNKELGNRQRVMNEYREYLQTHRNSVLLSYVWQFDLNVMYHNEVRFRSQMISLALQAYYMEHGELPETLDVLEGSYLEKLPTAPVTGKPFEYVPHPDTESKTATITVYEEHSPKERRGVPYLRIPPLDESQNFYRPHFVESIEHLSFVKK
ncbi:MAG: ABC transporter permease [Planctomycetaceae bacterium]|jgi:hypothetical protein|nr:ABC transporter permease [Planctomycetaceae bacterium]